MSMLISYINGTQEEKHFKNRDEFKWFLGVNAYDSIKISGYRRIK